MNPTHPPAPRQPRFEIAEPRTVCPGCGQPLFFWDGDGEPEWYCPDCERIDVPGEEG